MGMGLPNEQGVLQISYSLVNRVGVGGWEMVVQIKFGRVLCFIHFHRKCEKRENVKKGLNKVRVGVGGGGGEVSSSLKTFS